jgi:hypothetical protein
MGLSALSIPPAIPYKGDTEATSTRTDLYDEAHRGLRRALLVTVLEAGDVGADDDAGIETLRRHWIAVAIQLRDHHDREDAFVDPLIDRFVLHARSNVDQDHATIGRGLEELDALAARLWDSGDSERGERLHHFYRDLCRFSIVYLEHMAYEEEVVMPELRVALTDQELAEVAAAIHPPH